MKRAFNLLPGSGCIRFTFSHHRVLGEGGRAKYEWDDRFTLCGRGWGKGALHDRRPRHAADPVAWLRGDFRACGNRLFPFLAERFTVIAPDLPGIGDSDIPADGLDMKSAAIRIHDLAKSLGVQRPKSSDMISA